MTSAEKPRLRIASPGDAEPIHTIYAPLVESTAISFETSDPGVAELQRRIAVTLAHFPWLVATLGDRIVGYAYAGAHRQREAYQWSADVSVYVAAGAHRLGIGRNLYRALLQLLRVQGYVNAFAGIALPSDASVGLHESLGFTHIGIYRQVGYKLGAWRDVGWWQLRLVEAPTPGPIKPFSRLNYEEVDPVLLPRDS